MEGNPEWAEVLADIRSLRAECELLIRLHENVEQEEPEVIELPILQCPANSSNPVYLG